MDQNQEQAETVAFSESPTQVGLFDRQQAFELAKRDLDFLAALAMPTVYEFPFPPILKAVWALLIEKEDLDGFYRLLLGLPRGHAKTTLIKLFVLWCILYSDRQFILTICASSPKAENFMADVWGYLAEPNIINVFGNAAITAEEDNKSQKIFSFRGRQIVLAAVGQGSVRGINVKNLRPEVIVFDDVQDKENAESETESNKLLQWIQSTAMKLRSPRRCFFIFIGNKYRVPPNCVCILERMQNNNLWTSIVTGAILEDGQPLWPELHSLESLYEEFQNDINMGTPEVFLAEIMNDTESSFNSLINVAAIPMNPFEDKIMCQGRFIIIDVATTKIGADDTAIECFGIYPHFDGKEKVVLEEIDFGSFSPKDTIQKSLSMCFRTGANLIGVESTAYQSSLLFWFNEIATELNIEGIEFVELVAKGKKNGRILSYLKQLLKGDTYLANAVRAVIFKQALAFKPSKTNNRDDVLDAAEKWQQVIEKFRWMIQLPSAVTAQSNANEFIENNSSF
jgi:hypothetical protein